MLKEGEWNVGVMKAVVVHKVYLVSSEDGCVRWARRDILREYEDAAVAEVRIKRRGVRFRRAMY